MAWGGTREGGWFGIKNNLSLAWRGNATLLILFTIIIVFTILSSLEISLSQSLQNIVFKYLAAHLSLDGRLKLSAQRSRLPYLDGGTFSHMAGCKKWPSWKMRKIANISASNCGDFLSLEKVMCLKFLLMSG